MNHQHTLGRSDGKEPWVSAQTRANLIMAALGAAAVLAWHMSVVLVCGIGVFDLSATIHALTHLNPVGGLPGNPHPAGGMLMVTFGLMIVAVFILIGFVSWVIGDVRARTRSRRRGGAGLAGKKEVQAALGRQKAVAAARRTRPSISRRDYDAPGALGLELGRDARTRQPLLLGFDDSAGVLGPTGAGKSSCLMEPAALSAPGVLIVTSNEVGILDTIATTREAKGKIWVFDPLNRASWPEPMVWDPVAGCQDGEMALARARAFVAGCGADGAGSTNAEFFRRNAEEALKGMLHAAAIDTRERTMSDVLAWCGQLEEGATTPRQIIESSTDPRAETEWAAMLKSVATGAEQTVSSSRATLAQVVTPLTLSTVKKWVIPHTETHLNEDAQMVEAPVPVFNAHDFVRSHDTLVLLSDDTASTNVGPLCTMLFQEVIDALKAYVPMSEAGILDPPMRIVGDEIANIAPVEKLPELVTELRKLGVQTLLAFQSDQQAKTRWGDERGATLWENMAAEIVMPGVKSKNALERYSDLAGTVEVLERTDSFDAVGQRSGTSRQVHERKVLRPEEIRMLDPGLALVIYRGTPGIIAELEPWYKRAGAHEVTEGRQRSAQARRQYAQMIRAQQERRVAASRPEGGQESS